MKSFLPVKGILVVLLLVVVALGSGTALASRQAAVAPQQSFERLDGAVIVPSSLCTQNDSEFTVWGSGWGSGELILLSLIKGAGDPTIWFSGSVNAAGAFQTTVQIKSKQPRGVSDTVTFPGAGLFTLEALGTAGGQRLATTPILVVDDKCPAGTDSTELSYPYFS